MSKCNALVNGQPCRARALRGTDFCFYHTPRLDDQNTGTIIDWIQNPQRFGREFKDLSTWQNWLTFLKAMYGLPFDDTAELESYRHFTGRMTPPEKSFDEAWLLCGRRGGKSRMAATIAAFEALAIPWAKRLAGGELANIFILASDKAQARNIYGYLRDLIRQAAPGLIKRDTREEIELTNRVVISIRAGDIRALRGYSLALAIIDEACQLRDASGDYCNPLQEVLVAIRPSLLTEADGMPAAKIIGLSTPLGKLGVMYDTFKSEWANDESDVLCWRGTTMEMNPRFSQSKIEKELKKDPVANRAEYLAEWRDSVSNLFHEDKLTAAMGDHLSRPYEPQNRYLGFLDPSSLKSDSFTMAIGHVDKYSRQIVIDRIEERRPPGDVNDVVDEYAQIMGEYHVSTTYSDAMASGWVESAFRKKGYSVNISKLSKSDLYIAFSYLLGESRCWLPYSERAFQQLMSLERRVTRSGAESVDHPAYGGAHDDLGNAVAGACVMLSQEGEPWSEREAEAHMPQRIPPPKIVETIIPGKKKVEQMRECAEEMERWMRESDDGVCPLVKNRLRLL